MATDPRRDPNASVPPYEPETGATRRGTFPSAIKRISWGAVFAGAVVALVVQLMLNLLGLSVGMGAINLTGEGATLQGLGVGAGIWLAITTIISFFAGGWAAGRLAGLPRTIDGLLHGFVAWAVASFVMFYLVFSGVGVVIGGALSVVQQGTELLGRGVAAAAPEVGRVAGEQIEGQVSADEVRAEVYAILRDTGKEELQPENLAQRADTAAAVAGEAATEAARSPEEAEEEIQSALDRLIVQAQTVASEADRQAVVNVLVERTDMSEAEARETVREYEQAVEDATARVQETAQQVGEQAVHTADDVLAAIGRAALWAFIAMVVGAASAAGGGFAGTPVDLPASSAVRRE